jgi:hypothetical protein
MVPERADVAARAEPVAPFGGAAGDLRAGRTRAVARSDLTIDENAGHRRVGWQPEKLRHHKPPESEVIKHHMGGAPSSHLIQVIVEHGAAEFEQRFECGRYLSKRSGPTAPACARVR